MRPKIHTDQAAKMRAYRLRKSIDKWVAKGFTKDQAIRLIKMGARLTKQGFYKSEI